MKQICRTCGEIVSDAFNSKNLYEDKYSGLLQQLQMFTGLSLKNYAHMPKYICKQCEDDFKHVIAFRKKCIDTDKSLSTQKQKQLDPKTNENLCELGENIYQESEISDEEFINFQNNFDGEDGKNDVADSTESKRYEDDVDIDFLDDESNVSPDVPKKKKYINWKSLTPEEAAAVKLERRMKKFICEECGRNFNCPRNLRNHLLRHAGIKEYECDICDQKFITLSLLTTHRRTRHDGERPYACKYCDRSFGNSGTRASHERIHLNERPFKCETCGKAFIDSVRLKDHEIGHIGERKFPCDLCNQSFTRRKALLQHYKSKYHKQRQEKFPGYEFDETIEMILEEESVP